MSLVQHEKGGYAPTTGDGDSGGVLGSVPHSIRGSANTFTQFSPTTPAFDRCTACSPKVVKEFEEHKFDFVKR
ncbi:Ubiquitinlike modifieractivating enzyme ATG7like, partial [Caligus rogercresseyi]